MVVNLQMYTKRPLPFREGMVEYQSYEENVMSGAPTSMNTDEFLMKYDPLWLRNEDNREIKTSVSDGGTLVNIKKYEVTGVILIPSHYNCDHILPILEKNIGKGMKLKERNRHRVCPICQTVYPVKLSYVYRGKHLTCGDDFCVNSLKTKKEFLEDRSCLSCGNTFSALINTDIEREYKTLSNSFCSHECILNAIPEKEYYFRNKEQFKRQMSGMNKEYKSRMQSSYDNTWVIDHPEMSFKDFMILMLGACIDSYGNQHNVYEIM